MDSSSPLPNVEPADSSDTRWALQTAQTLWGQGELREALQWVRRAAEAAAETGQDDRALALAKAGAELRAHLEIPRTMPPPALAEPAPHLLVPRPAAPEPAAAPAPATRSVRPDVPPPSARGETELVVTVIPADPSAPAPDASLVSHRAVRVAVSRDGTSGGLAVRLLSPGEVAPKDATVALLVGLAPGISPIP